MKKISSFKYAQAGVTLVELMIGLTVGLIVTGGAMAILFGNQKMLLEKGRLDRTQEEFRFATTTITRLIRQANSFSVPASNNELVINFDSSQRDCLGVSGVSTSNKLKLENNQLLCIRNNEPDKSHVLAKNIGSLQFSYGTQQSGAVTYNSYFSAGTTVNTTVKNVLNNITSIKTKISIVQDALAKQPVLEFIATSHQKSSTTNLSSGGESELTEEELKKLEEAEKAAAEKAEAEKAEAARKKALDQILALLQVDYKYVQNKNGNKQDKKNWSALVGNTTNIAKNTIVTVTLESNTYDLSGWSLSSNVTDRIDTLPKVNTSSKSYSFNAPSNDGVTLSIYLKNGEQEQSSITFITSNQK